MIGWACVLDCDPSHVSPYSVPTDLSCSPVVRANVVLNDDTVPRSWSAYYSRSLH